MTDYEALKARVQELAERDWDIPAIEARHKKLLADGILEKTIKPVFSGKKIVAKST